jgi:hypothetical protein
MFSIIIMGYVLFFAFLCSICTTACLCVAFCGCLKGTRSHYVNDKLRFLSFFQSHNPGDIVKKHTEMCLMCGEKYTDASDVITLGCKRGHVFHADCVPKKALELEKCPIC